MATFSWCALNRMMQGSDLFPCGDRVHMPYVRANGEKKSKLPTSTVRDHLPSVAQRSHLDPAGKLKAHVSELGEALAFSEEVVSARSPQSVSYCKAREGLASLFKGKSAEHRGGSKPILCGRHDCRGTARKHLPCHLVPKPPTSLQYSYFQSLHPEISSSSVQHLKPLPVSRGAVMVAQSLSAPWTEQTLQKLSSSTAVELRHSGSWKELETVPKPSGSLSAETSLQRLSGVGGRPESAGSPRRYALQLEKGAKPVTSKGATIVLDNHTRFEKVLQTTYPSQPGDWYDGTSAAMFSRGQQRWLDFPQPCKTPEDLQWVCHSVGGLSSLGGEPCDAGSLDRSPLNVANEGFFDIMREWAAKWHIHVQLKDAHCALEGLSNLCDNTRKAAVVYITLMAEDDLKNNASEQSGQLVQVEHVAGLERLLDDPVEHIRVPAALALYCMDKHSTKAEQVLLAAVASASPPDSWACVQCLALAGTAPAPVISKLITYLVDSKTNDRAAQLLSSSSANTGLVHALMAEVLNSSSWRERQAACLLLPRLHGGLSQDICGKLVLLAWEDWRSEVRQAAAQALGLSGHGKLIHDEIAVRLDSKSEAVKLDALKKLHSLQLMTSRLLPAFVSCFEDPHTSVRVEAASTAGSLRLQDPRVQAYLHSLLRDPSCLVKATTLRALAAIGQCDEVLVSKLLWAVRFEKLAAVRAEACRTLASLCPAAGSQAVVDTLQDLLLVEDDPLVQREAVETLGQLGSVVARGDDMLETIRSEIEARCTRERVTSEIVGREKRALASFVMEGRPQVASLTTRDYLGGRGQQQQRPWSPDRRTIDAQLSAIRNKCLHPDTCIEN